MESQLTIHLKKFNDKVKVMNQSNAKDLTLTKLEAQNLQADIFELLTKIADLTETREVATTEPVLNIGMDGGGF
mgnify:CR=1 FL=1